MKLNKNQREVKIYLMFSYINNTDFFGKNQPFIVISLLYITTISVILKCYHLLFAMIQKASSFFSKLILIGMSIYSGFFIYDLFKGSESLSKFMTDLLNYSIVKNNDANITIGKLILEIGLLVLSFYLSKLFSKKITSKLLNRTSLDLGAKESILRLSQYIMLFVFIGLSLSLTQIPVTAFAFVGGALAIGAGFGSQNMINNFISGLIIQFEKPIKVGDTVQVETSIGKVIEIGVRSTKIRLSNKTHLIVPNSFFLEKNVTNWHFQDDSVRSKLILELDLSQKFDSFKDVVRQSFSSILESREISINISEIKTSGYIVEISFDVNMDSQDKAKLESKCREHLILLNHNGSIKLSKTEPK